MRLRLAVTEAMANPHFHRDRKESAARTKTTTSGARKPHALR